MKLRVGIVGFGAIGKAFGRFFARSAACEVAVYDKALPEFSGVSRLAAVDAADITFVCVPTPFDPASGECDLSAIHETVAALNAPLCIKSTVPPGTTDALRAHSGKRLAFSPEFAGESAGHPWPDVHDCGFVLLGGDSEACRLARHAYELAAPVELTFRLESAVTLELLKYMENAFLATKVAFVNQFYDLAAAAGVDYERLRELFVLDPRAGASHTMVTAERGFGGKCLPKDVETILAWGKSRTDVQLLDAVKRYNDEVRAAVKRS